MKDYATANLRNVALVGHQGSGKTSLAEAVLFKTGAINRLGSINDGNTVGDYEEEEIKRGMSLSTALIPVEHGGNKINMLDAPGFTDFIGEIRNAMRVADGAVVLVDASAGVETGTELVWNYADEFNLPRIVVISKMNMDMARSNQALQQLKDTFSGNFVQMQFPLGDRGDFPGVVDLSNMVALMGEDGTPGDIPGDVAAAVEDARTELIEAAAEGDDTLLEKYLEGEALSDEEIAAGLKAGFMAGSVIPVFYTAATENGMGVMPILDAINRLVPSPVDGSRVTGKQPDGSDIELTNSDAGPLAVWVFRTTADPFVGRLSYFRVYSGTLAADSRYYNVTKQEEERVGPLYVMRGKEQLQVSTMHAGDIGAVAKLAVTTTADTLTDKGNAIDVPPLVFPQPVFAVAVVPQTQGDSAKMGPILSRLCDEDPTLNWRQDSATKESVLEGMGDIHVTVAVHRAAQLGVGLDTKIPKVPYKETVTREASNMYRHKKQSGGSGQFGEVHLRVEPRERGEGFEYASEIFGGSISQQFIPSIEKGIQQVLEAGPVAGYPVVDIKAIVFDGKMHPVDSKDIAFQIAGREAFKLAMAKAGPVLLEPIVMIRIVVPDSNMGDVMGDLSTRRAHIQGTESESGRSTISALVPLAEVQRYSNELRSFTQGRGIYTLEFDHYEAVPSHVMDEVIAKAKQDDEEEE